MRLIICLILFIPSILLAQGISESSNQPYEAIGERGRPIYDRPSAYDQSKSDQINTNTGNKIKGSYSPGRDPIDKQLRESAFNLSNKAGRLKEKARYYQRLGWATAGGGGYFFWKARQYRKEASKTKKAARELLEHANKINDIDDGSYDDIFSEDSTWIDASTDIPSNIEIPPTLITENGKISDEDFLNYLKDEHGIDIQDDGEDVTLTENGVLYDSDNPPVLSEEAYALLSDKDKKFINQGVSEEEGKESKVAKQQIVTPAKTMKAATPDEKNKLYRAFLAKQKNQKPRRPAATAAGKVVLYNGEPIGHKFDNLFDMIHRAYEKATDEGLFYPPNTRLNPDGTPRK